MAQHTRAVMVAVAVLAASIFGQFFGGGATSDHAERPAAGVPRIRTSGLTPPTGGVAASSDLWLELEVAREQLRREAEEAERLRLEEEQRRRDEEEAARRSLLATSERPRPGCGYESLIRQMFPPAQGDKAVAVAMRESGCTNTARNPSGASGLFQLMMPMHQGLLDNVCADMPDLARVPHDLWWEDAVCNVRGAVALWQGSGWGPWGG